VNTEFKKEVFDIQVTLATEVEKITIEHLGKKREVYFFPPKEGRKVLMYNSNEGVVVFNDGVAVFLDSGAIELPKNNSSVVVTLDSPPEPEKIAIYFFRLLLSDRYSKPGVIIGGDVPITGSVIAGRDINL